MTWSTRFGSEKNSRESAKSIPMINRLGLHKATGKAATSWLWMVVLLVSSTGEVWGQRVSKGHVVARQLNKGALSQLEEGHGMETTTTLGEDVEERHILDKALVSLFASSNYVPVSPGTFERKNDDDPVYHKVSVTKTIEIGRHEVTQAQWAAVMGHNPSDVKNWYNPVESISWFEVQDFLDSLNAYGAQSNEPGDFLYRLPTEAEWEYVCRAGSQSRDTLENVAWFNGNAYEKPHPVGHKKPNAWGVFDMQGNVWEWVDDWYGMYDPKQNIDPVSPASGRARIIRGGSWWSPAEESTCSYRGNLAPDYKAIILGFRLVREKQEIMGTP